MTADDVRLTAQLVVQRKVHCVSDASVEALAKRVLELEQHEVALSESLQQMTDYAEAHAANARTLALEECARIAEAWRPLDPHGSRIAEHIRARRFQRTTPTLDVKRGGA
jgi:hypothetical protein